MKIDSLYILFLDSRIFEPVSYAMDFDFLDFGLGLDLGSQRWIADLMCWDSSLMGFSQQGGVSKHSNHVSSVWESRD